MHFSVVTSSGAPVYLRIYGVLQDFYAILWGGVTEGTLAHAPLRGLSDQGHQETRRVEE